MVDFGMLSRDVRNHWPTQYAFNQAMRFGGSTRNAAWHGKPLGVVAFLRICKAINQQPLAYLVER